MILEIHAAGEMRKLGCLPRLKLPGEQFPVFKDEWVIPRDKWTTVSRRDWVPEIRDQDGIGACNAFAACMAMRVSRLMAGKRDVKLSEGCLYGQINGGRDQGSMLGDALEALAKTGTCLDSTVGPLVWQKSKWPSNWLTEAAWYRLLEAYDCPTFEHIASAIQLGFVADYGIMVGNNFDVGNDGWVVPMSRGGGGHAMCGIGLAQKGSTWGIETVNSWGKTWGDHGFGIVPESYFSNQTFTDGWAVRAVRDESTDQLKNS